MTGLLAATLAVIPFGSLGALQQQIRTGAIAGSVTQGRFIVVRYDDNERVSYQVAKFKKDPPTLPQVYILGGSAVRECMTTDDALRLDIERRGGVRVGVHGLASSMQGFAGALAIIDNLPAQVGGIVVIGVHHLSFAGTSAQAEAQLTGVPLKMTSKALHDFIAARFGGDPPNDMLAGLRQYLAWYLRNRGVPAFRGNERRYQWHRYFWAQSVGAKRAQVAQFESHLGARGGPFFSSVGLDGALLRRCVTLANARGYRVLLMEDPQDRAVVGHAYDVYKSMYRPVCRRIARTLEADYVDLNTQASLNDRDFYDLSHLIATGRAKWTPRLAAAVAQILRDHFRIGAVKVSLSDPTPDPAVTGTETIRCMVTDKTGQAIDGARATFTWHLGATPTVTTATTDAHGAASSTLDISAAPTGVPVVVEVQVTFATRTATRSVSFTPTSPVSPTPSASASP